MTELRAIDPTCSTVVAWYDRLPDAFARLVGDVQATCTAALGHAFLARDPGQVHATLVGLERAAAPFDPEPLAAYLGAVLAEPLTIRFGGVEPGDLRLRSRGRRLYDRTFVAWGNRVVLVGWPVVAGVATAAVAEVRDGCAAFGVTHRYGRDPDVYLVIGDVTDAPPDRVAAVEARVRADLAAAPVSVPLSAADLTVVTYADPALPRASSSWQPLLA